MDINLARDKLIGAKSGAHFTIVHTGTFTGIDTITYLYCLFEEGCLIFENLPLVESIVKSKQFGKRSDRVIGIVFLKSLPIKITDDNKWNVETFAENVANGITAIIKGRNIKIVFVEERQDLNIQTLKERNVDAAIFIRGGQVAFISWPYWTDALDLLFFDSNQRPIIKNCVELTMKLTMIVSVLFAN